MMLNDDDDVESFKIFLFSVNVKFKRICMCFIYLHMYVFEYLVSCFCLFHTFIVLNWQQVYLIGRQKSRH